IPIVYISLFKKRSIIKKVIIVLIVLLSSTVAYTKERTVGVPQKNNSTTQKNIYLNKNINNFITKISALDTDKESPLHALKKFLDDGHLAVSHDEILEILYYADWFIQQQPKQVQDKIIPEFNEIVDHVLYDNENVTKDMQLSSRSSTLTINKKIIAKKKALFKSDVIINKKLRVHGKARFYEDVKFKDDVTIEGTLSVNDLVVNNITFLSCLDDLCVLDLSVVDESISGTLSSADAIIQNL